MPIWRLWLAKGGSIREMMDEWTYDEVMRANALLDMNEAYEIAMEGKERD